MTEAAWLGNEAWEHVRRADPLDPDIWVVRETECDCPEFAYHVSDCPLTPIYAELCERFNPSWLTDGWYQPILTIRASGPVIYPNWVMRQGTRESPDYRYNERIEDGKIQEPQDNQRARRSDVPGRQDTETGREADERQPARKFTRSLNGWIAAALNAAQNAIENHSATRDDQS